MNVYFFKLSEGEMVLSRKNRSFESDWKVPREL